MAPGAPGEMDLFALLDRTYARARDWEERVMFREPPLYPEPGGTVSWGRPPTAGPAAGRR